MNKFLIAGAEVDLFDEHTPIGVSLSGGADSAILAYILMKYSPAPIHFFTLANSSKNFITVEYSTRVIKKCIELTGRLNVAHSIEYVDKQERDQFIRFLIDKVDNNLVKIVYTATTNIPPADIIDTFSNQLTGNITSRRSPQVKKPKLSHDSKLYHPFINLDKKDIASIYKELGVMEVFSETRSCESMTEFENHCGACWWCEERLWAFGSLE